MYKIKTVSRDKLQNLISNKFRRDFDGKTLSNKKGSRLPQQQPQQTLQLVCSKFAKI